jgi:integrase
MQYVKVKNGKAYFNRRGWPSKALRSPVPPEDQYEGSLLHLEVLGITGEGLPDRPQIGTLAEALKYYELHTPEFKDKADSTKDDYLYKIRILRADYGAFPVGKFDGITLLGIRNSYSTSRGWKSANDLMMILRYALSPVIIEGKVFRGGDPFAHIKPVKRPGEKGDKSYKRWPDEVVEAVLETALAMTPPRVGVAWGVLLARYAGPRRGDLVKLTCAEQHAGKWVFVTSKRHVPVANREDRRFTKWAEKLPTRQPLPRWKTHGVSKNGNEYERKKVTVLPTAPSTLTFNTRNQPYTEDGLGQAVKDVVVEAHRLGKIDATDYTLHGLRHSLGVELAERADATDAGGAAVLGHSSPNTFAIYRKQAQRSKLAAATLAKLDDAIDAGLEENGPETDVGNDVGKCGKAELSVLTFPKKS